MMEWHDGRQPEGTDGTEGAAGRGPGPGRFVRRRTEELDLAELKARILAGERTALARGITLIESNAPRHFEQAQELLQSIMAHTGNSVRIGISGVPGAGKSTFIESLGGYLCREGHRTAVLAVDPSSALNGGSILGDKTRMEELARNPKAFIRPSPSEGTLGGVHRKTRETVLLCEAAGFDVILIETVGVGQSEAIVRGMSDYFLLLALTGAGDDLQGMKKGILELVDGIVINKADGSNKAAADRTKHEYSRFLHFMQPATKGWPARAYTCSALYGEGIEELWKDICLFRETAARSGVWEERRRGQSREWLRSLADEQLRKLFYQNERVKALLPQLENEVTSGEKTVSKAVQEAFAVFMEQMKE